MRLFASLAASSTLAALAFPLQATAETAPKQPPLPKLDTVVVTAVAPETPLTFETDPKLPRQPVPASDGADYLKTIPGFSVIRNGGSNGDPVLRGMFGSRLNLLTNDGAMPGACPSRMDNPLSYISPETYDELVVVKGPQTVLWGPGASAGTVRFEREHLHFDAPAATIGGSLTGGSFDRNDQVLDLSAGAPLSYLRATLNRSDSDDYKDGDGKRVHSAWEKWNTDFALGWTPDVDTVLELSAGFGDGEAAYATRGMDGSQFERDSYGLRFEKKNLSDTLVGLEATLFHNTVDHVMDNYSLRDPNPAGPMSMASNVDRRTYGGRLAADLAFEAFDLTLGVDAQDSRHRRRSAHGIDAYRRLPRVTDAEFSNLGVFAEATWHMSEYRRLVFGSRLDRAEATDRRATLGSGMMTRPNPTAGEKRRETLRAGFLRLEGDLAELPLSWYAGIGHTERMPDYWELFSPNSGPAGSVNAFDGLDTEKTTQLDIGLQYRGERFDAWASAYAGRVNDFILFTYGGGGMMGMSSAASNIDADIRGAELGFEYRPADHWKLGATMAYAWGKNRDAGTALPQMPPLEARLKLGWDNSRWSAGALVRAVARQTRVAVNQGNVVGRDLGDSSGFATLALNAGYRFSPRLQLTAGIDNVFDRSYSEHLNLAGNADFGFPADPVRINEPGRTAWVKLNLYN